CTCSLNVGNDTPKILYKSYKKEKYANDFISRGKFRLGRIDFYKNIEDNARCDKSEGESSSFVSGDVPYVAINDKLVETHQGFKKGYFHLSGTHLNPQYLFCTSGPQVDLDWLRENMGEYIVVINNPVMFLEHIRLNSPITPKIKLSGIPFIDEVVYNKGEVVEINSDSMEAVRLTWKQKPVSYCKECEWRVVVTTEMVDTPDKYIEYDFKKRIEYAEPFF
ncbi:MAG: hypothetical protein KAR83_08290, partial [Thermodesulfovibrionales bacterium]|nr:hypothetical protein [Thermodesulfovibrionales bacterium]